MSIVRKLLGRTGEDTAERYLKRKGYRILERNFSLKIGEIDLIALDGDTVVFIEVKTRRGDRYGTPAEAVTGRKQAQIVKTALAYIAKKKLGDIACRFDVVGISMQSGKPEIEHIRSAFDAGRFC
ncbi:MAG: YraN family protein [Nitrospirota bacterium]|nr:YraN family protein [Nitrospirota bacterium]